VGPVFSSLMILLTILLLFLRMYPTPIFCPKYINEWINGKVQYKSKKRPNFTPSSQFDLPPMYLCPSITHPTSLVLPLLTCPSSFFQTSSWTLLHCCPAACQQVREREREKDEGKKKYRLHAHFTADFYSMFSST